MDWTRAAITIDMIIMGRSESITARYDRTSSNVVMLFAAAPMAELAMNISPNPFNAFPKPWADFEGKRPRINPAPANTSEYFPSFNATRCTVAVLPTFTPISTGNPFSSVIMPSSMNDTTSMLVPVEELRIAEERTPKRKPKTELEVHDLSREGRAVPKPSFNPEDKTFVPRMKSETPPKNSHAV